VSPRDRFAAALVQWHGEAGRKDLPWQREPGAYRVWISEIMLQQTQVATVIPYFERFIARFPEVAALAAADEDEVLHLWSGLGYYARARNLHRAAKTIVAEHGGEFPEDFDAVLALPGIGRSTAGAILALSANRRFVILDGNVKRVLARVHAVDGWPGEREVEKRLWALADAHTPATDVAVYTQAIMDLGATVCTRRRPQCGYCPVRDGCAAGELGEPERFPAARPRRPRPQRAVRMLLVVAPDDAVLLERRAGNGIWGGLWCPPELGDDHEAADWCRSELGIAPRSVCSATGLRHGFTHFDLDITPVVARVGSRGRRVMEPGLRVWYNRRAPQPLGLPAAVERLLERLEESARGSFEAGGPNVPGGRVSAKG
jgi:A/G-specific adenine glycosylase